MVIGAGPVEDDELGRMGLLYERWECALFVLVDAVLL